MTQLSVFGQLARVALWAMKTWGNPVERAGAKAVTSFFVFWTNPSLETQKAFVVDLETVDAAVIASIPPSQPTAAPSDPAPSVQPRVIMTPGGAYRDTSGGATE